MKKNLKKILPLLLVPVISHAYTRTSNMNLKSPGSGDTDYPTSISDSFTLIDSHDHSPGKGVLINSSGLADNSIVANKISSTATDNSSIEINAGTLRLKDGGVTFNKFVPNLFDNVTIDTSATPLKVKDGGITKSKLSPLNLQSAPCGTLQGDGEYFFSMTGSTPAAIPGCSVTVPNVTAGRAVMLIMSDIGNFFPAFFQSFIPSSSTNIYAGCKLLFLRSGLTIANYKFGMSTDTNSTSSLYGRWSPGYTAIDPSPSAGSNTYNVVLTPETSNICSMYNVKFSAVEI